MKTRNYDNSDYNGSIFRNDKGELSSKEMRWLEYGLRNLDYPTMHKLSLKQQSLGKAWREVTEVDLGLGDTFGYEDLLDYGIHGDDTELLETCLRDYASNKYIHSSALLFEGHPTNKHEVNSSIGDYDYYDLTASLGEILLVRYLLLSEDSPLSRTVRNEVLSDIIANHTDGSVVIKRLTDVENNLFTEAYTNGVTPGFNKEGNYVSTIVPKESINIEVTSAQREIVGKPATSVKGNVYDTDTPISDVMSDRFADVLAELDDVIANFDNDVDSPSFEL